MVRLYFHNISFSCNIMNFVLYYYYGSFLEVFQLNSQNVLSHI